MQFRTEQVDELKVVDGWSSAYMIKALEKLAEEYIFIDIQYAITPSNHYSALVLLRRKS